MTKNEKKKNTNLGESYYEMTAEQKVELLEMILNKLPCEVWYKDVLGKYVYVNRNFAVAVGRTEKECMGQMDYELFGDATAVKFRQSDWEFLFGEGGREKHFNSIEGRPSLEFKQTATDESGQFKGIVGCDLASNMDLLQKFFMKDNSSVFRAMFENSPYGIAIYSGGESVPEMVNHKFCELVGISEFTALNTDWRVYTHPDDIAPNEAPLEDFKTGLRHAFTMQKRFIKPNGDIIWANMTVSKLSVGDEGEYSLCFISETDPPARGADASSERPEEDLYE